MNKVFGVGLSRTGTTSLTEALNILEFKAVHFPSTNVTLAEFYRFFATQSESIKLSILKEYDAITDTPVCCLYKALDKTYPDSKFILTVREKQSWLNSCERFWEGELEVNFRKYQDSLLNLYIRFIHDRLYGTQDFEPETHSSVYDAYVAEVIEYFRDRPGDLLILNICAGEGWEKLAPFLGKSIPEVPFPHENRAQDIQDKKQSDTGNASER